MSSVTLSILDLQRSFQYRTARLVAGEQKGEQKSCNTGDQPNSEQP